MSLVVITIQDEPTGEISLGFTLDPHIESEDQPLTPAQVVGIMAFHNLRSELGAELDGHNDSESDTEPTETSSEV